ncbi:MAG: hypothetical protein P4L41_06755 [Flavipsychrobacter sp.]|nr:hypothetical protein [Flavipsychrobacter sp.]
MNNLCKQVLLAVALLLITATSQNARAQDYDDYAQNQPISTQTFYDDLAPYGQWVEDPQYGYVWVPNVDGNFRPYYTNGYWVMTDYGNTWVSDYPWGWAAFHYGRWTYDDYYGWLWIPGTTWGPAWVSWRQSDSYYGWAPLGPGISVSASWGGGYYCPDTWWTFIPPQYIYHHNYYHYWYGPENNRTIINNTTIVNNTYVDNRTHNTYSVGPRASEIERVTSKPVTVYHLQSASAVKGTSVRNGTVTMYHPMEVKTVTQYGAHPQPAVVTAAPRPVSHTPQSPGAGGTPVFRQQQQQEQQRTEPIQAPARTPIMPKAQPEPQRYEYNPQRTPVQNSAPQERQQQNIERQQPVQRQAPMPQIQRQAPVQQNIQRSQPAAPQMQRPAAPVMQAPRMQAAPAIQRAEPNGRR